MVDLIAPRRGESIVNESGTPTNRFFEYLEAATVQSNETVSDTEVDAISISLSIGRVGTLAQQVRDLQLMIGINPSDSDLSDQINALELISVMPVNASIARLQDQIDELKLMVI